MGLGTTQHQTVDASKTLSGIRSQSFEAIDFSDQLDILMSNVLYGI